MPTASHMRPVVPVRALNKLFQAAFSAAKRVRSETRIGENAVSLASATVSLAQRMYGDLSAKFALMIGAGEMIALAARHFAAAGVKRMVIANRTLGRAQALAAEIKGYAVDLDATRQGIDRRRHRHQLHGEPSARSSPSSRPTQRYGHAAIAPYSWWTSLSRAISSPRSRELERYLFVLGRRPAATRR